MHQRRVSAALVLFTLSLAACEGSIVNPEPAVGSDAAVKNSETVVAFDDVAALSASDVIGPFEATLDFRGGIVDPGTEKVVDGKLIIEGQIFQGPLFGDVTGTGTVVFNGEVDLITLRGSGQGTFIFDVTGVRGLEAEGEWTGTYEGLVEAPVFTGQISGLGAGDLKHTTIQAWSRKRPTTTSSFSSLERSPVREG